MAVIGELLVILGVNNAPLTAGLAKSEAELKTFGTSAGGLGSALPILGGVAIAATVIGVESIKSAAKFQTSMELIKTQAGGTQAEVDNMTAAILKLAPTVGFGPEALSEGLYHLESAGFRSTQAIDILTIAAEGAKVGHADLEEVTNALNAAVVSGIPGVANMSQAMGSLNAIVGAGDMRMSDLVEALGTGVLAVVKGFGVTLNDVGAALATFGDNNIRGADAATALRLSVQFLAAGTTHADSALAKIGLTSSALKNDLATGGLNKAITDLHDHFVSSGTAANEIGPILLEAFGKKAGVGLSILVGQYDRFEQKSDEVAAGAGNFGQAWADTFALPTTKMDILGASVEVLSDKLGTALIPAATAFVEDLTKSISDLDTTIQRVSNMYNNLPQGLRDLIEKPIDITPLAPNLVAPQAPQLGVKPGLTDVIGQALGIIPKDAFTSQQVPWGTLGTPGFHYGEPGSPFPGPMIPYRSSIINAQTGFTTYNPSAGPGWERPTQLTANINITLDGEKIGEHTEKFLYNNASAYSSGFGGGDGNRER